MSFNNIDNFDSYNDFDILSSPQNNFYVPQFFDNINDIEIGGKSIVPFHDQYPEFINVKCKQCDGVGKIYHDIVDDDYKEKRVESICATCKGTGLKKIWKTKKPKHNHPFINLFESD